MTSYDSTQDTEREEIARLMGVHPCQVDFVPAVGEKRIVVVHSLEAALALRGCDEQQIKANSK